MIWEAFSYLRNKKLWSTADHMQHMSIPLFRVRLQTVKYQQVVHHMAVTVMQVTSSRDQEAYGYEYENGFQPTRCFRGRQLKDK